MLKVDGVSYTYPEGTKALDNVTLSVGKGHISAILGESGSGKTTLLRCIGRFISPQQGSITIDGTDIGEFKEAVFRSKLGIVFQDLYLFPHLTVLRNMTLAPEKVQGTPEPECRRQALEMLERMRIDELTDRYPNQISGGQAQRVAIARALMMQPEYLLLDEPTSALDVNTTGEFINWLLDLQEFTAFIIVTHDMPFAVKAAMEGIVLDRGSVRYQGKIRDVAENIQGSAQPQQQI